MKKLSKLMTIACFAIISVFQYSNAKAEDGPFCEDLLAEVTTRGPGDYEIVDNPAEFDEDGNYLGQYETGVDDFGCGRFQPYWDPARGYISHGLLPGQAMLSCSGTYMLILQTDGNLVFYRRSDMRALWASGTGFYYNEHDRAHAFWVQAYDGNCVVYCTTGHSYYPPQQITVVARWANGVVGFPFAYLWVQDDAHLVQYRANTRDWLWSSWFGRRF